MKKCATGANHDVSSRLPARTLVDPGRPSRSPLIRPPQSSHNQETIAPPEGERWRQPFGVPCTIWNACVATGIFTANALLDWR